MAGIPFRSTLMPRAGGGHRLFVHSRIWRPLGLRSGSRITVELGRDPSADEISLPPFWVEVLERRSRAAQRFATLPPATRREIVRWLTVARQRSTRERRMEVVLDRLEAGQLRDRS